MENDVGLQVQDDFSSTARRASGGACGRRRGGHGGSFRNLGADAHSGGLLCIVLVILWIFLLAPSLVADRLAYPLIYLLIGYGRAVSKDAPSNPPPLALADLASFYSGRLPLPKMMVAAMDCFVHAWQLTDPSLEINHYSRSWSEVYEKRVKKNGDDEGEARSKIAVLNMCRSNDRALDIDALLENLRNMQWPKRLRQFHRGNGEDGQFCIANYDGVGRVCRSHFLVSTVVADALSMEYVRDWVDFHTVSGVDHFMLFDSRANASAPIWMKPYISNGVIHYVPCIRFDAQGRCTGDLLGYAAYLKHEGEWRMEAVRRMAEDPSESTFWIASHDTDEYMYPAWRHSSIRNFLLPYTELRSSFPKQWKIRSHNFGTSGWENKSSLRDVQAYRYHSFTSNTNGKSIALFDAINTLRYKGFPHEFKIQDGYRTSLLQSQLGPFPYSHRFRVAVTYLGFIIILLGLFAVFFSMAGAIRMLYRCVSDNGFSTRSKLAVIVVFGITSCSIQYTMELDPSGVTLV